jgi:hypothetical protein
MTGPSQILHGNAGGSTDVPKKAPRKVDDDLDIVGGIVDIEGEENMLVAEGGVATRSFGPTDYDSAMLLSGEALRRKIGGAAARHGLDREASTETIEILSLAARERLLYLVEEMHEIASARTGGDLVGWRTTPVGPDVYERLQQQREQEERSLLAQAEVRLERAARAAAKAAESTAEAEKSAKEAAATAEAKKKEQARLEKAKLAERTQKSALAKLMGSFPKVMKKSKTKSSQSAGGAGSSSAKASDSAPVVSASAGAGGPSSSQGGSTTPARGPGGATGQSAGREAAAVGPAVVIDLDAGDGVEIQPCSTETAPVGHATMNGISSAHGGAGAASPALRTPITLADCIHFMEQEPRSRKGKLIYTWYPRLGTRLAATETQPKKKKNID